MSFFSVSDNFLNGTIPTELASLTNLTWLGLEKNLLTGALPSALGQLPGDNFVLELRNNLLTGTIPSELGEAYGLYGLTVSDNLMTGTLPRELGMLLHLGYLAVHGNDFSGSIPEEWGRLDLHQFSLHNTQLTGPMPPPLCDMKTSGALYFLTVNCSNIACSCQCDCIVNDNITLTYPENI